MQFEQHLKKRGMFDVLHDESLLLHIQIRYSDFNGLLSMKIGQKNNGLQSVGVMRLGFSRENIQKIGLLER
ncbi:hypothetical protein PZA11_003285 [Diplocarpon coronariae]